jgi:universal stress protein E
MTDFRRILLAVKAPDADRQPGVIKAIGIAAELGASLELFHTLATPVSLEVQPSKGHTLEDIRRNAVEHAKGRLARFVPAARRRGVELTYSVEWDYPVHEAVVRRAAKIHADLIIAECHKGPRTRAWLIHLPDWELMRISSLPVLLLKNGKAYRRPVVLAAVDPAHRHAKPTNLDTSIIEHAKSMASALHGKLQAMHANQPSVHGLALADGTVNTESLTLTYADLRRQARAEFQRLMTESGVERSRAHFLEGDPSDAIPQSARKLGASLVVMGAVSRSGLKRMFIGNTAERVLSALPCDVLVVKPEGFDAHVPTEATGMRMTMPPPFAPIPV